MNLTGDDAKWKVLAATPEIRTRNLLTESCSLQHQFSSLLQLGSCLTKLVACAPGDLTSCQSSKDQTFPKVCTSS